MNLRDLEYLVAVDEERHFHKAAERCFVSQPTLSGQLKKLEQELGVMLVERSRRQVVMTDVGTAVAQQARKLLAEVKAIKDIVQTFDDPMAGELHAGLIPTLAPYLLPKIMPAIRKQYPKLKLWLHEYQTAVLLEKLRRAELDFLIQYSGEVIPVEVKSEENLQAKSLKTYCQKYSPKLAVRTSMSDFRKEDWMTNLPLYAISKITEL